ncbi:MAG: 30S ribosomal protein S20 [Bacilli bacterium]|jgi:small subunit ribosomal protein S20|nr:30S ribosomal protein S20 [Acholeplasmataceae bacterium]
MANIKQQEKRNRSNLKKRLQTAAFKSSVKTAIKRVETAVHNNDLEEAKSALSFAFKKLDKGLAKGIYHKNFVSRKKSRLSKLVNQV